MSATVPACSEVTLTFDNGPEPEVTPAVLEVLRRRGLHATFFVLGHKMADPARRALAERAHAEGHWIGNHTFTHSVPLGAQPDEDRIAEAEIGRVQALIGNLAHPDRLFRPFGGGGRIGPHLLGEATLSYLLRHRFTCVVWNAVPGDWRDPDGWVDRALAACRGSESGRASSICLVLHDLPTGAMRHLDRFLGVLADEGCRFPQAFPLDCVPIRSGEVLAPMDPYVTRQPADQRDGGGVMREAAP